VRYLPEVLKRHSGFIAFIDESLELDPTRSSGQFYIVSAVVLHSSFLKEANQALLGLNNGHPIHASELAREKQFSILRAASDWISENHDFCDIYLTTATSDSVRSRDELRSSCLSSMFSSIYRDTGVELFIFDSSNTREVDELDRRLHRDAIKNGHLSQRSQLFHQWPSEAPLLAMPDIVAWVVRQDFISGNQDWSRKVMDTSKLVRIVLKT